MNVCGCLNLIFIMLSDNSIVVNTSMFLLLLCHDVRPILMFYGLLLSDKMVFLHGLCELISRVEVDVVFSVALLGRADS